jgi:hypothetical protein
MSIMTGRRSLRFVAAALLALTTVLVGFAHRPPAFDAVGGDRGDVFAAFAMPDGSLPDVCHLDDEPSDGTGAPTHGGFAGHCDACLLSGAPGLGAVAAVVLPVPLPIVVARVTVTDQVAVGVVSTEPVSRGPPQVV